MRECVFPKVFLVGGSEPGFRQKKHGPQYLGSADREKYNKKNLWRSTSWILLARVGALRCNPVSLHHCM